MKKIFHNRWSLRKGITRVVKYNNCKLHRYIWDRNKNTTRYWVEVETPDGSIIKFDHVVDDNRIFIKKFMFATRIMRALEKFKS